MGEFKASFNSILNRDLKHIYSGQPKTFRFRHSNPYPTQEQLRIKEENKHLKTHVLKSSEFIQEYKCLIPRAPAFRVLSRYEIDGMVSRLTKPTVASQGISNTSEKSMREEKEKDHPTYLGTKKVTNIEMQAIMIRLTRPTKAAEIRSKQALFSRSKTDIF
ncbi:hypothetical protein CHS0354_029271 [Potamilus streckersoni]|uniref:Uncharacterized protein n=1 Tax=Potamilus streckersoni TaxID=2493646 RepID=A0AAE0SZW1_9BIVA|nr:hypothetical protein CHS0354_029271 [Potamilus streckersoni]